MAFVFDFASISFALSLSPPAGVAYLPPGICLFEDTILVGAKLAARHHAILTGVTKPRFGRVLRGRAHDGVALPIHAVTP